MQKELLSAYIDGEQVNKDLTEVLCQDEALQTSWSNFHVIRSVMRQETDLILGADFTARMEVLIEQEEVQFAQPQISQPEPEEAHNSDFMQKLKSWFSPMTQVAVAAAVCLVAVLGVQTFNQSNQSKNVTDTPVLQTLPFNNAVQEVSYNAPTKDIITSEQLEQKNRRIGAMLQNYELQRRVYAQELTDSPKHK